MDGQIPIKIESSAKHKPKNVLRTFLITFIILLVVLNLGLGFVWWQGKIFLNDFSASARRATKFANQWGVSADVGLPTLDVAGSDVSIGRFPGSVRTYYLKSGTATTIEYKTTEIPKIILDYFRSRLAQNGWVMLSSSDNDISFTRNTEQLSISFDPAKQSLQVSVYDIVLKTL